MPNPVSIGNLTVGAGHKPLLIVGPCVLESESLVMTVAETILGMKEIADFQFVFKASYAKDNRSAGSSFRGPGMADGLRILADLSKRLNVPVLSDVHGADEVSAAAEVLDIIQIPAFLSRQTSLIEAAARCGKPVNVKKAQFMAPEDMDNVVTKFKEAGGNHLLLTERGTSFGYHNLVVDFRGFSRMRATGCPVIYDVTHSLQRPGGLGTASGGEPELATEMARAAAAIGVDGFFIETHPDPASAQSDAASMLPLNQMGRILRHISRITAAARELEND